MRRLVAVPRSRALILALCLGVGGGCSSSRLWTGVFRSIDGGPLDGIPEMGERVYLELVIGHFGPDLTGIVRFFRDPEFLQPVPGACPCQYILEGRYDGQDLLFAFPSPVPCAVEPGSLLAARLTGMEEGDRLEGPLGLDLRTARVWAFRRVLDAKDLTERDKECTPRTGNSADVGVGQEDLR